MADSFKVVFNKGKNPYGVGDVYEGKNQVCFAAMNGFTSSSEERKNIISITIIIEEAKVENYSEEYVKTFLDNIKLIGTIGYSYEKNSKGDYIIELNMDEIKNPNHSKFVSTALRCLYEPRQSDSFSLIGKHFVNLCNFFPEEDRGKLFCIATNIYCYHDGFNGMKGGGGYQEFNSNHLHVESRWCEVLTSEQIRKKLNNITQNMHTTFRKSKEFDEAKFKQDLKEETFEGYKVFL